MASSSSAPPQKKTKFTPGSGSQTTPALALVPYGGDGPGQTGQAGTEVSELITRPLERLSLTVSPAYLQSLREAGELGFRKPFDRRIPTVRFYDLDPNVIRDAMLHCFGNYYAFKVYEAGQLTQTQATAEAETISPLVVDVCISALYAKLRTIHKSYGTYGNRYNPPSRYTKDVEIPLPFADAISTLGVFMTRSTHTRFICIPNYPEGVKYEGRLQDELNLAQYFSVVPYLKEVGIPVRSIDPHDKTGSAWWTYRAARVNNVTDLFCVFPALHYSDHSAVVASMFIHTDEEGEITPIITHKNDDVNYQSRFQSIEGGFQIRAFAAICGAPSEEWNSSANVD